MTKRFGTLAALDDVSLKVTAGSFHALLGENGAGKSTLVKCVMGYYQPDAGEIIVGERQEVIDSPRAAHALGLGMVYQHFTLVPAMTVTENLVLARDDLPAVVNWAKETKRLTTFLQRMPFTVPLDAKVSAISAGERQKCEILKQLYLKRRFLILDEPTSVLTPAEADEVLGMLRGMVLRGELTILMITHKFREVLAFADEVTILRRGKLAGRGRVKELTPDAMARIMIGAEELTVQPARTGQFGEPRLDIAKLDALDDAGQAAVRDVSLSVRGGEIVGIAGVSGNGQRQLVEVLAGQREAAGGEIRLHGRPYQASREQMRANKLSVLPEEPLKNACVARMSVADNLALREFDRPPFAKGNWWLDRAQFHATRAAQDRSLPDKDPLRRQPDRGAFGRQRAAHRARARARRRGRHSDRRQSLLRARLRGGRANPCRDHGGAQPRRRGAAGERGSRRAARARRPRDRDVQRRLRLRSARERSRSHRDRPPYGRPLIANLMEDFHVRRR